MSQENKPLPRAAVSVTRDTLGILRRLAAFENTTLTELVGDLARKRVESYPEQVREAVLKGIEA